MKNILNFIDEWGMRIVVVLTIIIFLKTCTTNTKIDKVEKTLTTKIHKTDSIINTLPKNVLNKDGLVTIIKETPNWKTLELEELSDKNNIPINKLKNDHND